MNIFNLINESVSGNRPTFETEVYDESRTLTQMFSESISEINGIVSDLALENYSYCESAITFALMNESVQLEALTTGFFAGVKKKVKAFFAAVIKFIKELISRIQFQISAWTQSGEKLVATYGSKVDTAKKYDTVEVKGYKYTKYADWASDGSSVQSEINELQKVITDLEGAVNKEMDKALAGKKDPAASDISKAKSTATTAFNATVKKYKEKTSEMGKYRKEIVNKITGQTVKGESFVEAAKDLLKIARSNSLEKKVIKVADYGIDKIKTDLANPKDLREISALTFQFQGTVEDAEKTFDEILEKFDDKTEGMNDVDTAKKDVAKSVLTSFVNDAVNVLSMYYGAVNTVNKTVVTLTTEEYALKKQLFIGAYKSLSKKANKDSVEEFDEIEEFEDFDL